MFNRASLNNYLIQQNEVTISKPTPTLEVEDIELSPVEQFKAIITLFNKKIKKEENITPATRRKKVIEMLKVYFEDNFISLEEDEDEIFN